MNIKQYYQAYTKYEIVCSGGMTFSIFNLEPLRNAFSATMKDEKKLAAMSCAKGIDRDDIAAALRAFRQGYAYHGLKPYRIELRESNLSFYLRKEDDDVDDGRYVIWIHFSDSDGDMSFRSDSGDEIYAISWRNGELVSVTETFGELERFLYLTHIPGVYGRNSLGSCKVTEKYPIKKPATNKEG